MTQQSLFLPTVWDRLARSWMPLGWIRERFCSVYGEQAKNCPEGFTRHGHHKCLICQR